ncbi:MAG TPA: GNAT family N-acetyltransferase [Chloroflexia bacterium]|nr:GNAT family N-acetyltransferase [Chloroflexia bacterium]
MKLTMRPYCGEDDYWRIRDFLREVFLLNDRREWSWQACRFDYCRRHVYENVQHLRMEDTVYIWETRGGRIGAALTPEGRGDISLQVHPGFGTPSLLYEMLAVAEERLARPGPGGSRKLEVWAHEHDTMRHDVLAHRGYTRGEVPEYQRRRPLHMPIPDAPVAPGYTIRALGDVDEHPARSWVSWKAFHPDEPDDRYEGWEWYRNVQRAPLYRRDLDLVAVAPDGEFASFCTVWFDDVTRTGTFEPVGTAPAHQRRGLSKAVMCEGLRRLVRLGATMAYVGSYSPVAHAAYASVGFTEYDVSEPWEWLGEARVEG